ncbi:hypothetical protein [Lentzea sp. NPDC003310]|uniref:GH36-type glycosyl hydrolase domain-containing protein n=1 Tax=Lentzea sp. NPDC003310 TaxID=3154447 RepID=UPI0033BE3AFE
MSAFGEWTTAEGLPAFEYRAGPRPWDRIIDPPTSRHQVHVGNRRLTLAVGSDGLCGVWDEHLGCRWLAEHTGIARFGAVSTDAAAVKLFGPTFFRLSVGGVERTVLCPEGDVPWVLIRVRVTNQGDEVLRGELSEEWEVRPREVNLEFGPVRGEAPPDPDVVGLQRWGGERVGTAGGPLRVETTAGVLRVGAWLELGPGEREVVWFRFGLLDGPAWDPATAASPATAPTDPATLYASTLAAQRARLLTPIHPLPPTTPPEVATELPWHLALLTGGACQDGLLGGHTLDQGSAYSFRHGFNGAARDPLQHALPLAHLEPDLALSVLRNTCAWGSPDGDLPYALDGRKQPWTTLFRPSDQNLWALWLAAEYAAATGDVAAFAEPVPYHPCHGAEPVPLAENLRRQFRFLTDVVGTGDHGHVRILNADWNDLAITESGVDRDVMIDRGESVLNSAMAAWVLPVYAALAERLGDGATANEARAKAEDLRRRVADEWNGRWFRRAYGPGAVVGDHDLWLEVQPWAILCGAATGDQARALLRTIDETCRAGSPLGARHREDGQVWFSVNMTLVWAASRYDPDLAWDEWRRMTLHAHTAAYPDVWSGTLSGPDCYLAPESDRPGETWALPEFGTAMQAYPVANLHSHSQPLLAYLRLQGIEPRVPLSGERA